MIKIIILKIAKALIKWGFLYIYDYIDKNGNGEISKEELDLFYKHIKEVRKKWNNRYTI